MESMHSRPKDPELKSLFETLQGKEQKHYDSLATGTFRMAVCRSVTATTADGKNYMPRASYDAMNWSEEKQNDAFLATDCIATEKLVSGEYNTDVFVFGESGVRKLLADIQVEEQNHAEMLYKYKMANGMS